MALDTNRYNANPKRNRARFDQAEVRRNPAWPTPANRKGRETTAPRLGGQFGRVVRNEDGDVVTLSRESAEVTS